ncbi:pirin family protein [Paenibacillus sp. p3-SID867]|uniref:pirin family protein n=1 Tax=Paenibacillus sp. p3-SID867 TaxID=2916363 RepID=UPI0021A81F8C|nr:pirin family protein [Paenibacillus sp. p3-SID867]MCT1403033.1 pirin family protein [Paenibacillus sp. p3-SID867]
MNIHIYPPRNQGFMEWGAQLNGHIPVSCGKTPDEKEVGPLFYWNWFRVSDYFSSPIQYHHRFEILTYMLQGTMEHDDVKGKVYRVSRGGVHVLQTATGGCHQERFLGPRAHGFQIWFDPKRSQSVRDLPRHRGYQSSAFSVKQKGGVRVRQIIGDNSPIVLKTDVSMIDLELEHRASTSLTLAPFRLMTMFIVEGQGNLNDGLGYFQKGDFVAVYSTESDAEDVHLQTSHNGYLRAVIVDVRQYDFA